MVIVTQVVIVIVTQLAIVIVTVIIIVTQAVIIIIILDYLERHNLSQKCFRVVGFARSNV